MAALICASPAIAETYRGVTIAPEHRCTLYSSDDYPYPQSVEAQIVAELGGAIYGPYTGTYFRSTRDTDIEHIVARSEAHDSGLCAVSAPVKAAFAGDPLNLTLAHPRLNRHQKSGKDVAEWTPAVNTCWFAARTLEVRRKYRLTIDRIEAAAVERILTNCSSTAMVRHAPRTLSAPPVSPAMPQSAGVDALALWDDNRDGRITCAEARRHGIAPVPRGIPPTAGCGIGTETEWYANDGRFALLSRCPDESTMLATKRGRFCFHRSPYLFTPSSASSKRGGRIGDHRLVHRPGAAFLAVVPPRGGSCPISRV